MHLGDAFAGCLLLVISCEVCTSISDVIAVRRKRSSTVFYSSIGAFSAHQRHCHNVESTLIQRRINVMWTMGRL